MAIHELCRSDGLWVRRLIVACGLLVVAHAASGQELLYVLRDTEITSIKYFETTSSFLDSREASTHVFAGTILVGLSFEESSKQRPAVWKAQLPNGTEPPRFVRASDVILFVEHLDALRQYDKSAALAGDKSSDVPPVAILTSGNHSLIQAWNEANEAVKAANDLPEDEKPPEPYFARAAILNQVSDFAAALDDCARGNALLERQVRDPTEIQRFSAIHMAALLGLRETPVSQSDEQTELTHVASAHISSAVGLFGERNYSEAAISVSRAISLRPSVPYYWYLRAICRYQTGDVLLAQSDALIGASFERSLPANKRHEISRALIRIQGPVRYWLQTFRENTAELSVTATRNASG